MSYKPERDTGAFSYASHAVALAVDEGAAVDVSFDPGDCVALPP